MALALGGPHRVSYSGISQIQGKETNMAHQAESTVVDTVVQLLCESGLSHMADAVRILLNEAMKIERSRAIEAEPYERSER